MAYGEMDDRIKEIARQIQFKELAFAKFKFIYDNEKLNLGVIKGAKHFIITLNSMDTYDIRKVTIRKFEIVKDEEIEGIYNDQLKEMIQEFFNFEYVMGRLFN
jgi:ubiquitin C-terminal hydrolase